MQVKINKQEGYIPSVHIIANEGATDVATIDEWIRNLRVARAWLSKVAKKEVAK